MKAVFENGTNYKEICKVFDLLIYLGYEIKVDNKSYNEVTFSCVMK
jgi:hypothetical protein